MASTTGDVDGVLDDGWGAGFPVKGREIEATVLFADITAFSTRTLDLSPAATLVYVQNFFAWITAEALSGRPGIVDKYIGDEVMVVFSTEFGSENPIVDAVRAAAAMSRNDVLAYRPHIGIASGRVIRRGRCPSRRPTAPWSKIYCSRTAGKPTNRGRRCATTSRSR